MDCARSAAASIGTSSLRTSVPSQSAGMAVTTPDNASLGNACKPSSATVGAAAAEGSTAARIAMNPWPVVLDLPAPADAPLVFLASDAAAGFASTEAGLISIVISFPHSLIAPLRGDRKSV